MLDLNAVRKVATLSTENMSAALKGLSGKGGGGVHRTGWVDSQAEVMGTTWGNTDRRADKRVDSKEPRRHNSRLSRRFEVMT